MDLFKAISTRYSYRGEYTDAPVPEADLKKILQAGVDAPTACNAQSCSFVAITNPTLLRDISRLFADRPFMNSAKAMIAIISHDAPVYNNISFHKEDCAAAAENMLLAITDLGYASVWLDGVLRVAEIAEIIARSLQVPDDKRVQILLPVGVPAEPGVPQEKKPFAERVFFNRYGG